jgi:hypothetical protein
MNEPLAELLQSLEHVTEEVRRLALVLRQVLEAQQRGERLVQMPPSRIISSN